MKGDLLPLAVTAVLVMAGAAEIASALLRPGGPDRARITEGACAAVVGTCATLSQSLLVVPLLLGVHRLGTSIGWQVLEGMPAWRSALVCFVLWDGAAWLHHWGCHRLRWLWPTHAPHHTGTAFNATLAWRQSWISTQPFLPVLLVSLLGCPLAGVAMLSAVTNLHQGLQHAPWWGRGTAAVWKIVANPQSHEVHHTSRGAHNLGASLLVWDRIAGTFRDPDEHVRELSDWQVAGATNALVAQIGAIRPRRNEARASAP